VGSGEVSMDVFRAILDSVEEGIHVVDPEGKTIFYNKSAARMEGLDASEVVDRYLLEVFPSLTVATSTLFNVLNSGKPISSQQQTYTSFKGRKVTTINSTLPLVVDGKLVGAVEVSRDITHVKRMSERIVDLQAELLGRKSGWEERSARGERAVPVLYTLDDFVSADPRISLLKTLAGKAARTMSSVLVYGETGTGKEVIVQSIHSASARRDGPFIAQNCAAVPESLLEGLLFGTARGGFTGAKDRPGLFELAHKGTLYLDEINAMPIDLQAKLLRAIQERTVRRIGETSVRRIDVRIIASISTDPAEALARHEIRPDLYYRLNVVFVSIPPLRERKGDIALLVSHFIRKYNREMSLSVERASDEAMTALQSHQWPGNVRELEHAIEGAMNLVDGKVIEISQLPSSITAGTTGDLQHFPRGESGFAFTMPLGESLAAYEMTLVRAAMERSGWNISRAARLLGIPRQTLQYRIKTLGIAQNSALARKRAER